MKMARRSPVQAAPKLARHGYSSVPFFSDSSYSLWHDVYPAPVHIKNPIHEGFCVPRAGVT